MGMAEDIAQIRWTLDHMHNPVQIVQGLDEIKERLKYDIEPKLDKALSNQTPEAPKDQQSPEDRLRHIRYVIHYASTDRKIEAIKHLRQATDAGLKEAKDTIEWMINGKYFQSDKEAE